MAESDTMIMKLTESGVCFYKRPDGSYYEQNKTIPNGQIYNSIKAPVLLAAQQEPQKLKISAYM